MSEFLRHLRHAARSLKRSPVFAVSAALTLAVCIGANVAIFSIVDTLLLRPLPFPDAGRLVSLDNAGGINRKDMLRMDVAPWMNELHAFSSIGLFTTGTLNLSGGSEPVHVKAAMVSPGFFTVLGVRPALGRPLLRDDHQKGGAYAVVLSDGLWRRLFAGDRSVPGRTVLINERSTLVVGIMPPGFDFPDGSDLWVPATVAESPFIGAMRFHFVGRLRNGATFAQARSEVVLAAQRNTAAKLPPTHSFEPESLQDALAGPIRPTLLLFLAAVALVLLVGCANVANLVLARMTARRTEMAVRAALGAGRGALVRQCLMEIALVALVGGLVGLVLARASLSTLLAFLPGDVPGLDRVSVDPRAAAFALILSVVTVLLVGLLPALKMGAMDLQETTRGTGRGQRAGHRLLPRVFVVAEMTLAVLLSAGAALLAKSFLQLANVHPGFERQQVLTMTLSTMDRSYRTEPGVSKEEQARARYLRVVNGYRAILDRLRSIPGVENVGATDGLPMNVRLPMRVRVRSENPASVMSVSRTVTPGYFGAMKIPLIAGSDFPERYAGHPTAIISRTLARRLWGKDWVPGSVIRISDDPADPPLEVVGVVGDVRSLGPEIEAPPEVYEPHSQTSWSVMTLAIRTHGDPLALARRLREEIRAVDPTVPVFRVETLQKVTDRMLAPRRASMLVLALFAGCALLLAVMGVYGVTSYLVGLQTRDFGVRLALGARPSQVLRGVLQRSASEAAIAAILGTASALALGRVLKAFLVNVAPNDPLVLAITCLAFVVVAIGSSLAPARRAALVDPAVTLRVE